MLPILLISSLDISRRNLALRGKESFAKVSRMAEYAREEINSIGGFYAYGKDMINGGSIYDFDVTKLSVYTRDIGLAGIEVYDLLRDEYDIQIELGDIANILAYISIGDRIQDIERLVGALGGHQAPLCEESGSRCQMRSISSRQFAYHRRLLFIRREEIRANP